MMWRTDAVRSRCSLPKIASAKVTGQAKAFLR